MYEYCVFILMTLISHKDFGQRTLLPGIWVHYPLERCISTQFELSICYSSLGLQGCY